MNAENTQDAANHGDPAHPADPAETIDLSAAGGARDADEEASGEPDEDEGQLAESVKQGGYLGKEFRFYLQDDEDVRDRVVRCCREAVGEEPLGQKARPTVYRDFISCGQEKTQAAAQALTAVKTSCAMFVRAVRHWCGGAAQGPYKPGTGMFVSMGGVSETHPAWVANDGEVQPQPGDYFYMASTGKDGHTGIFLEDLGDGEWQTAEGGGGDGTLCRINQRKIVGKKFNNDPLNRPLRGWFDCTQVGLQE